jgi:hypothetical protein
VKRSRRLYVLRNNTDEPAGICKKLREEEFHLKDKKPIDLDDLFNDENHDFGKFGCEL